MTKRFSLRRLSRWLSLRRRQATDGFTLLELLVAMFIGGIITALLLYGVVEILQINQRESSRAETQREMQLSLDYISAELREAVFVYDGGCLKGTGSLPSLPSDGVVCPGITNFIPSSINAPNIPVLAFWRIDELPQDLIGKCVAAANAGTLNNTPPPAAILGVPCISRRTYTLVVYFLDQSNTGNTWSGKARIKRYELAQFKSDGSFNPGWVDPTTTVNRFLGWPFSPSGKNLQNEPKLSDDSTNYYVGSPTGTPAVLVDFVDDATGDPNASQCPADAATPAFVRTPIDPALITSFYACVRGGGVDQTTPPPIANNPGGRNQEVAIFIRGNAAGRSGVPQTARVVFDMQTRTLTRGSYNKNPAPQ